MHYGIIDSSGNLLEWFDEEDAARVALYEMVDEAPDSEDDLALLTFDESGDPVGEALRLSTTRVSIADSPWLQPGSSTREVYEEPAAAGVSD